MLSNENQNQAESRPEERAVPLDFVITATGAESVELIDRFTLYVTPLQVAQMVFAIIPDWLKDSRVPIPMPANVTDEAAAKGQAQLLDTGRIAMKGFVAASGMLINMAKDLYGREYQIQPRQDSLPIVSRWMSWFVASQVSKAPLEIIVRDGFITDIRQSIGLPVRGDNTEATRDHSTPETEG